jgi:hypothetical protein
MSCTRIPGTDKCFEIIPRIPPVGRPATNEFDVKIRIRIHDIPPIKKPVAKKSAKK